MKKSILLLFTAMVVSQCISTQLLARDSILKTAARSGKFNRLVSLLVAADLDDALSGKGHFTVFAPTDEAFSKLPKGTLETLSKPENKSKLAQILKYHVIPQTISVPKNQPSHPITSASTLNGTPVKFARNGSKVRINDSNILDRNIRCSNGLIHGIDSVLLPAEKDDSIVGVAKQAKVFNTLLQAATTAGLAENLQTKGLFTVFAPTDKAFQKLGQKTIESLLKKENRDQLVDILKYHVVSGKVSAADAVNAMQAKTLNGQKVKISIQDGKLKINQSTVTSNDVMAKNGIIHIVDTVLMPPMKDKIKTSSQRKRHH